MNQALLSKVTRLPSAIALFLVAAYRVLVSPLLVALFGARCRFHPSCSEYATSCLTHEGLLRGGARALRRLSHCHPFHPGGVDEYVPPPAGSLEESARFASEARLTDGTEVIHG